MRTLHVVNVRWFNATAWYGLTLARLLHEAGHETLVLVLPGTPPEQIARDWGLPVKSLPLNTQTPWGVVGLLAKLKQIIADFRPDVVNCHRGESFFLFGLLRKLSGSFRLVRTRGDQRLPRANVVNKWLHKNVADAVISTNSRMTRHFVDAFGLGPDKVHQILGGVDRQKFAFDSEGRNRVRREFGCKEDDFVVGLLGRFDTVKGQEELIRAVSELYHNQGHRHIRLMLIGFTTAVTEAQVKGWIKENHGEAFTVITGKRDDIAACISALDLGVVASKWSETIARAALEIMSCSVPLISTNVGVMPDLLEYDALFAPGDVTDLRRCLTSMLCDPDRLQQTRTHQQQTISGLGLDDFLRQTLKVYGSCA
ncbi:MAG TPA: glycosyltransferase [Desulfomicrobiaceae bacterium]|nr:glycosyltransferase [Desulfomicrobiaceae bacterium]